MSGARIGAIAFDLDGTLIDSRPDLATAVNRVRADFGLAALSSDAIGEMIGEGARNLVRRALGGAPEPALLEQAMALFYDHYDAVCTRRTKGYPGIDELLTHLARARPLALLTNKPERFARKIVDHLGWSGRFEPLIGGDTLASRKPDPEGALAVCRSHGVDPADVVLVGDSGVDARTAVAAGCRFVFATWGYARPEERAELASGDSVRDAAELERWISARSFPP